MEQITFFLHVAEDYKRWSNYGQVAETYSAVYLSSAVIVEKVVLSYISKEVSELLSLILKLKQNWKQRSKQVDGIEFPKENGTKFASSISSFRM